MKPKHHWLLDIAPQIRRDNGILDMFVVERGHLVCKALAEHIRNTSTFDVSLVSGVHVVQLRNASELSVGDRLIGSTARLAELPRVEVAKAMRIWNTTIEAGEVVFRGDGAALVLACAQEHTELFFIVAPLEQVERLTPRAARCRRTSSMEVWRAVEVRQCKARQEVDAEVVVIGL